MAVVVSESSGRAPRIRDRLHRVVGKVTVTSGALFRRSAGLQASIAIIAEASDLSRLVNFAELIPGIVGVGGGGVDSLIPIQFFNLLQAPQHIFAVTLANFLNQREHNGGEGVGAGVFAGKGSAGVLVQALLRFF